MVTSHFNDKSQASHAELSNRLFCRFLILTYDNYRRTNFVSIVGMAL